MFGALAVVLGAFGAHSLKNVVGQQSLEIWEKGVQYQFYHTFALLGLATFIKDKNKAAHWAYILFTLGIVLFSGSLYILALKDVMNTGLAGVVGPITPIGGLCFILGWCMLLWATLKDNE